ncbi:hypothetical protein HDZ31DRAFT_33462 [Schizophyllum fasciatum]
MLPAAVPLASLSLSPSSTELQLVEHPLVHFDPEKDFQWVMRSDMLNSFLKQDWTLLPTAETLQAMMAMARRNARADASSRKVFTEVRFSECEHEYDLKYIARVKSSSPIYVDLGNGEHRAYDHPYVDLLRVKSRAHPFFVIVMVDRFVKNYSRACSLRDMKVIHGASARLTHLWSSSPPVEYKYGPNVRDEHRHPRSVAGDVARGTSLSSYEKQMLTSKGPVVTTIANTKRGSASSSLGKRKREGGLNATQSVDVPPRLCPHTLFFVPSQDSYTALDIEAWRDQIEGGDDHRCTSPATIAEADAALAQYVQEARRDPLTVMRTGKRMVMQAIPVGQERDTSRFSSNNWAELKCQIILWGYHYRNEPLPLL